MQTLNYSLHIHIHGDQSFVNYETRLLEKIVTRLLNTENTPRDDDLVSKDNPPGFSPHVITELYEHTPILGVASLLRRSLFPHAEVSVEFRQTIRRLMPMTHTRKPKASARSNARMRQCEVSIAASLYPISTTCRRI